MLSKNEKTILEHVNERDCVASAYLLHVVPGRAWVEVSNIGCGYRKIALEGLLAERPIACMAGCLSEWPSQLLPRAALPPSPRTYLSFELLYLSRQLMSTASALSCLSPQLRLRTTHLPVLWATPCIISVRDIFLFRATSYFSAFFWVSCSLGHPLWALLWINSLSLSLSSSSATLLPCSAAYAANCACSQRSRVSSKLAAKDA